MKLMIVGSGGREHALAECLACSDAVEMIHVIPGNDGLYFGCHNKIKKVLLPQQSLNNQQLIQYAKLAEIDFTIVGPEMYLAQGIVDDFKAHGLKIFGPTKNASQLESSKIFSKEVMIRASISTAQSYAFNSSQSALSFLEKTNWNQMVVKCDGLASGKGVVVCENKEQALNAIIDFMVKDCLGFKVESILIEEMLVGKEVSVFYLCDGKSSVFLNSACDHKRLLNHDLGPNTGGMGAYSPAPIFTKSDAVMIQKSVVQPLLNEMNLMNKSFQGVLFIGLMKTASGYKVLEFNTRFGDPETQTILPLLNEDLLPWLLASAEGKLDQFPQNIQLKNKKSIHVVMAANGYPGLGEQKIQNGDEIFIDSEIQSKIFFAGVKMQDQKLKTYGGRILGLTSTSDSFKNSRHQVYDDLKKIQFKGSHYRTDIGDELC